MEDFFKWRREWRMGIREIDEQHHRLVGDINSLAPLFMNAMRGQGGEGASRETLLGRLNRLRGELERHFRDEEKLMFESGYAHCKRHIHGHVMFLAELKNYCQGIAARTENPNMETLHSLKTWFITHILDDREFASHYQATRPVHGAR